MNSAADLLVVDDEQVVRGAVRKVAHAEGLAVDGADTAEQGLRRLADGRYRIVLLDLMLPAGGGMRVLDAARDSHPDTPVVMITGYATPERKVECFGKGAFDVLPKPFDANELIAVMRLALEHRERPGRPETFRLGHHAWARLEAEGTAGVGIGPGFDPLYGGLAALDTPPVGAELVQGKRMAVITGGDGLPYRVWAPLSGKILETNDWERDRPLFRVVPSDLKNELARLTRT